MIVAIPRKLEREFMRRAWRRYPREYIEILLGKASGSNLIVMAYYPIPHTADRTHCYDDSDSKNDDDMYGNARDEAKELGLEVLGSIHTHPSYSSCCHMSPLDVHSHIDDNLLISGIAHIFKFRRDKYQTVCYYSPWEPVEVRYV